MNKKETVGIIAMIVASYPSYEKLNEGTITGMAGVWQRMFADEDAKVVELALAKHISTSTWPPSVADIKKIILEMQHPELIPPDKAWSIVEDTFYFDVTISRGYDLSEVIPPKVRKAVDTIGWNKLSKIYHNCSHKYRDDEPMRLFLSQYKPMYERECKALMLPKEVANALSNSDSVQAKCEAIRNEIFDKQNEFWRRLLADEDVSSLLTRGESTQELLEEGKIE